MKKGLLYSSLTALAIVAGVSIFTTQEEKEYYTPREGAQAEEGINGAMEYYRMLKANPATGEVSDEDVLKAREQVAALAARSKKKSALDLAWDEVGPDNVGGRTRAFLIDKDDPDILYAGGVAGGLFRSTNGGSSWHPVSDPNSNLIVVSIAQASDGTIYYGTGEGMYNTYLGSGAQSTPAFLGGGIYKSTDGGNTFTVLASTEPAPNDPNSDFAHVGKLAVDPNDPDRVYAATNQGLQLSKDGGQVWENAIPTAPFRATDMVVTPSGTVWVKVGNQVRKSVDGNSPYENITSASNLPNNNARMRIAVSPQDEDYVYVISIDGDMFGAAWQSTDGGDTWTKIGERTAFLNPHNNQGNYNNALTVDPNNKERIIVGGVQLWEWSEQGGWQQIANSNLPAFSPFYIHADNHDVVYSKTDPNTFYVVNDGGVFRTRNNGFSYAAINNNYSTMQFYHIGVGPNGNVMGGSQDNGTDILEPHTTFPKRSRDVMGGDGGYSQLSKLHPGVLIAESQHGATRRSADNGETFEHYIDFDRMDPDNLYATDEWGSWVTPFQLWEKLNDPKSEDSIRYGADTIGYSVGFGSGLTSFVGSFPLPTDHRVLEVVWDTTQDPPVRDTILDSAIFVTEGVTFIAGEDTLYSQADSTFGGDGTGTFDPATGEFSITFNDPVVLEITGRAAVRYKAGRIIEVESAINSMPLYDSLSSDLEPGESNMIQDPVQAMFFIGLKSHRASRSTGGSFTENHSGGIWMTREILSRLDGVPQWNHIGNLADDETPTCMDVSDDGDILYVGTNAGRIYRFSNISNARDSASTDIDSLYENTVFVRASTSVIEKTLMSGLPTGQVVTSIAVDPRDKGRVVATYGNYGKQQHVFFNDSAAFPTPPPFEVKQGNLPEMPVYASTFNATGDSNQVLIGTEYGVYTTDNISNPNSLMEWQQEINQFAQVPVFTLVQDMTVRYDLKDTTDFEGVIYAGTHGLGIWKTTSTANYVQIGNEEHEVEEESVDRQVLGMYPNPATDLINIEINLESRADVEVQVRDMNGKLVKQVSYNKLPRETENVELRIGSLPKGAYIVSLQEGQKVTTGKFIKR